MLMPYSQRSPGSKFSGAVRASSLPVRAAGRSVILANRCHLFVPRVVNEAGGMGQQVAQGDLRARRAHDRNVIGVEAKQDLGIGEQRQDFLGRLVQRQFALFGQLHRRGGGDRLGHRRDAENRIGGHPMLLRYILAPERRFVDDAIFIGSRGHKAGDFLAAYGRGQGAVYECGAAHTILIPGCPLKLLTLPPRAGGLQIAGNRVTVPRWWRTGG